MDAMTMAFPVRDDPGVVAILRPGDRIEATLVVDGPKFWLEQVLTKGFVPTPAAGASSPAAPASGVAPASLPGTDPNPPRAQQGHRGRRAGARFHADGPDGTRGAPLGLSAASPSR
jgi:hypothetical protein